MPLPHNMYMYMDMCVCVQGCCGGTTRRERCSGCYASHKVYKLAPQELVIGEHRYLLVNRLGSALDKAETSRMERSKSGVAARGAEAGGTQWQEQSQEVQSREVQRHRETVPTVAVADAGLERVGTSTRGLERHAPGVCLSRDVWQGYFQKISGA